MVNRPTGSGSMPSKIINKGSSINTNKPIGVLNRLAGSGAMLVWHQSKPAGVFNRFAGSEAILGKRDIINILSCIWLNQTKTLSAYI